MPPKPKPKTRGMGAESRNLRDILNGFRQDPNDPAHIQLREMATNVMEKVKKSYTYDYASTSTQNRRSLHLAEFVDIIKATVMVNETNGAEHENWEERLWGKDYIEDNLRAYVLMVSQMIQPRSFSSESIKFSTLAARRQSMVYWVLQKCDTNVVSIKDVWNGSNKALYMAFREHNISVVAPPKLYANKNDIKNLIEFVTYADANVEMAQQMVIAWLDAFICGVRPGTIAASKHRSDQYLRWEDIEITRLEDGNFQVLITHKWLKGYRDERLKPLRFMVSGPQYAEDVMFSLPHRLLALALRRGILLHFTTVEELLESNRTKITIAPIALKQPVILASSPKGIKLVPGKAALASGLTNYLQRRAFDFGLPPNVTMYIWRRSAGTTVGRVLGNTKARGMLGHEMTGRTYETSYEQGTIAMDVTNLAMGRQLQTAGELLEDDTLSVNRIKLATNNKAAWTKKWIAEHPEYIKYNQKLQEAELNILDEGGFERVQEARSWLNKTERTLNNQAAIAFQQLELQLVQENMTVDELKARKRDAKALGKFEQQLKEAADAARAEAEDELEAPPETMEPQDLRDSRDTAVAMAEDEDEDELAEETAPVKVSGMSGDRGSGTQRRDDTNDAATEAKAILASSKMLLDILVAQESTDSSAEMHCRACEADETVPDELPDDLPAKSRNTQHKTKLYKKGALEHHLASDYHSPKMKWYRKMGDDKAIVKCPFDPDWTDCQFSGKPKDILNHALRSITQSDEHLLKAAQAGLFARDFDATEDRELGVVKGKGKRGEGSAHQAFGDPDEFELAAFVPPRNINDEGEVEEDDSVTPYNKTVRLPPNADLVTSTLYQEHATGMYGRIPDVLQAQRSFLARRAEAILRQHGTEQTAKGETKQKATSGKGKRRVQGIAKLRKRLADLNFDWGAAVEDEADDDAEEGDTGAGEGNEAGGDEQAGDEDPGMEEE